MSAKSKQQGGRGKRDRSAAEITRAYQGTRRSVSVILDEDAVDQKELLEQKLVQAREADRWSNEPDTAPDIAQQITDLEAATEESQQLFTFAGVGRRRWAQLLTENPPTPAQRKMVADEGGDDDLEYDIDAFPPIALATSCIFPTSLAGNFEGWQEIWDNWTNGQTTLLWRTMLSANQFVGDPEKSAAASDVLRALDSSLPTASR